MFLGICMCMSVCVLAALAAHFARLCASAWASLKALPRQWIWAQVSEVSGVSAGLFAVLVVSGLLATPPPIMLAEARGLAFRGPAGPAPGAFAPGAVVPKAGSAAFSSRGRVFPSIPAGVLEARVTAAAAEWLLLHAAPAAPDALCAPPGTGAPVGGEEEGREAKSEDLDIFALLHKMLWPLADNQLHLQAMGMADLPPEASPMQIYEWLSATAPMVHELHNAEKDVEGVPSDCGEVRSGFRGGVEAVRVGGSAGSGKPGRRKLLDSQYTRVYRSIYTPLLYKGYRPGDAGGAGTGRATSCRLRDTSSSPVLQRSSGSEHEPRLQYLRGGSGGWGFFNFFAQTGCAGAKSPGIRTLGGSSAFAMAR
jgi:hypothetical protein